MECTNVYNASMAPILDEIRAAIRRSGVSRYRISRDLGIHQGQLSDLMKGTKGLSVAALERLADYLGRKVTLRPTRPTKAKGR